MPKKLELKEVLGAIDLGGRQLWEDLSDDEKKDVVFFVLNRWISSVNGSREHQELAILKTNEYYNKNFFDIGTTVNNDHRRLLWHLLCMSGDTGNIERHNWIKLNKRATQSDRVKLIHQLKPHLGIQEVELLAELSTKNELIELAQEHGLDKPKLK